MHSGYDFRRDALLSPNRGEERGTAKPLPLSQPNRFPNATQTHSASAFSGAAGLQTTTGSSTTAVITDSDAALTSLRKRLHSAEQSLAHQMEMTRLADDRSRFLAQENDKLKLKIATMEESNRSKAEQLAAMERNVSVALVDAGREEAGYKIKLEESEKLRDGLCERLLQTEKDRDALALKLQQSNGTVQMKEFFFKEAFQRSQLLLAEVTGRLGLATGFGVNPQRFGGPFTDATINYTLPSLPPMSYDESWVQDSMDSEAMREELDRQTLSLRQVVSTLEAELAQERQSAKRMREAFEALSSMEATDTPRAVALIVKDGELSSLRSMVASQRQAIQQFEATESKLLFQLKDSKDECQKLNEESELLNASIRKLQLELRTEKQKRLAERDETQSLVAESRAAVSQQDAELHNLKQRLQVLESLNGRLEQDIQSAVNQNDELRRELEDVRKKPHCGEACATNLQSLESLQQELVTSKKTIHHLNELLRSAQAQSTPKAIFDAQTKALEDLLEDKKKQLEISDRRQQELQSSYSKLLSETQQYQDDNLKLREQIRELNSLTQSLRSSIVDLESRSTAMGAENEQLRMAMQEMQRKLMTLSTLPEAMSREQQRKMSVIGEQLIKAASEIEELTSENDHLRSQLTAASRMREAGQHQSAVPSSRSVSFRRF